MFFMTHEKRVGTIYQKNCDRCHRSSYSSVENGEWLCPVCNQDLTQYPLFDAITFERIQNGLNIPKLRSYRNERATVNTEFSKND